MNARHISNRCIESRYLFETNNFPPPIAPLLSYMNDPAGAESKAAGSDHQSATMSPPIMNGPNGIRA